LPQVLANFGIATNGGLEMARKKTKDLSEYRPNSAMIATRIDKDTRAGLERLAADSGVSMSKLTDKAIRRLTALNKRPHLDALIAAIITHAQDCEKDGANIGTDPEASRKFHDGMAKILARYTAVPSEESEALRIAGWLSAETAMALTDRGVDWSAWKDSAWSKATLRGRK
jgi:hypothetical protein